MDIEFNIRSEMTNLVEKVPGLVRRQSAAWHNVVEQLAARHELHDHKDIGRCVNHFVTDLSEFEERERVLIINIFDIKLYTLTGHLQSNNVRMCAHLLPFPNAWSFPYSKFSRLLSNQWRCGGQLIGYNKNKKKKQVSGQSPSVQWLGRFHILRFTFPNAPIPSVLPSLYCAKTIGTLSMVATNENQ